MKVISDRLGIRSYQTTPGNFEPPIDDRIPLLNYGGAILRLSYRATCNEVTAYCLFNMRVMVICWTCACDVYLLDLCV